MLSLCGVYGHFTHRSSPVMMSAHCEYRSEWNTNSFALHEVQREFVSLETTVFSGHRLPSLPPRHSCRAGHGPEHSRVASPARLPKKGASHGLQHQSYRGSCFPAVRKRIAGKFWNRQQCGGISPNRQQVGGIFGNERLSHKWSATSFSIFVQFEGLSTC